MGIPDVSDSSSLTLSSSSVENVYEDDYFNNSLNHGAVFGCSVSFISKNKFLTTGEGQRKIRRDNVSFAYNSWNNNKKREMRREDDTEYFLILLPRNYLFLADQSQKGRRSQKCSAHFLSSPFPWFPNLLDEGLMVLSFSLLLNSCPPAVMMMEESHGNPFCVFFVYLSWTND